MNFVSCRDFYDFARLVPEYWLKLEGCQLQHSDGSSTQLVAVRRGGGTGVLLNVGDGKHLPEKRKDGVAEEKLHRRTAIKPCYRTARSFCSPDFSSVELPASLNVDFSAWQKLSPDEKNRRYLIEKRRRKVFGREARKRRVALIRRLEQFQLPLTLLGSPDPGASLIFDILDKLEQSETKKLTRTEILWLKCRGVFDVLGAHYYQGFKQGCPEADAAYFLNFRTDVKESPSPESDDADDSSTSKPRGEAEKKEFNEQILALFKKAGGDPSVKMALVEMNKGLAIGCATNIWRQVTDSGRIRTCGFDLDDMIQDAQHGLIKAVRDFDLRQDHQFSTYAAFRIKGQVRDQYRIMGRLVHVPKSMDDTLRPLRKAQKNLREKLRREPTVTELAKELGKTPEKVEKLLWQCEQANIKPCELMKDAGDEVSPIQAISCQLRLELLREWIDAELLSLLNEQERRVIEFLYYKPTRDGSPASMERVAKKMKISVQTASRRKRTALEKMRTKVGAGGGRYLEIFTVDESIRSYARGYLAEPYEESE